MGMLILVDLRPLEFPAEIAVDDLYFGEEVDGASPSSSFPVAHPATLGPTEGQLDLGSNSRGVNVDQPKIQIPLGDGGPVDVLAVEGRGEAEGGPVSNLDVVPQIFCGHGSDDWSEDLLLGDLHGGVHIGKDRRGDEVAVGTSSFGVAVTAQQQSSSLLLAYLYVAQHPFQLVCVHQRSHLCVRPETVPQLEPGSGGNEPVTEGGIASRVNDHPAGRRAALARRTEPTPEHSFQRQIQIRIVHDDNGVLAPLSAARALPWVL